ncbi:MAG: exo-alpha-sialidase [Cyclobacteriaceae bacterium]|nr:exo-alpha-sialidase [Cyclobacteriaceae bacterium]
MNLRWILLIIIMYSVISCDSSRSPEVIIIENPAREFSGEPWLFTDAHGKIILSWIEREDTLNFFKLAVWHNNAWSEPQVIASGSDWFVNWADYPMAISNDQGKFISHFLEKSGEDVFAYDVKVATSPDGKTWSTPFLLHDDAKQAEHGFVSWIPYDENFFVSWLDGRNTVTADGANHADHGHRGMMSLRSAVLNSDGKKLEEWELDTRTCDCCQTTSAITSNGPIVIYRDRSDKEIRDISIVRWVDGKWTTPKPVYQDGWEINGCPVNGPRCEAIGNQVAVAWFTLARNEGEVNVVFSADGGETFGDPIRVDRTETIGRVDLVMLEENRALVSWMEGSEIKIIEVNSRGEIGQPVTVAASSSARASGFPQLTKANDGVMAAWTDAETKQIKTALVKW